MSVHEDGEAVLKPVPDVPSERTLVEEVAMLLEEGVPQPLLERLTGVAALREKPGLQVA